jgi:putative PIN family toxin of toxin-antitoxin system
MRNGMPADRVLRVFLDTSVWVAGIASEKGAAREILRLAEAGLLDVTISERVLVELDRVMNAKLPGLVREVRSFLAVVRPRAVDDPPERECRAYRNILEEGDASILAAAEREKVNYLVTWDRRDFLKGNLQKLVTCRIVDPGEFLREFREHLG